jgi:hypothetical protein
VNPVQEFGDGRRQAEAQLRARYEAMLTAPKDAAGGAPRPGRSKEAITVERVRLTGVWPRTLLAVDFRHAEVPDCRFAWHWPIWTPDTMNQASPNYDEYLWVYLREYVGKHLSRHRDCKPGEVKNIGVLRPATAQNG